MVHVMALIRFIETRIAFRTWCILWPRSVLLTWPYPRAEHLAYHARRGVGAPPLIRGLHWLTFRLNLSAFCGIRLHSGVVYGVFGRCPGVSRNIRGCVLGEKRLRLS